ncbi:MAG: 4Fe-4S binding protein [Deferribacterota bacterium]|nr:4Fe-4S binding protein [Deferribacterota bacterium]
MHKYSLYVNIRRLSQLTFLILFFYLAIETTINIDLFYSSPQLDKNIKYFLAFDPLVALIVIITTGTISAVFIYSFFLFVLTIIFGRFFCGFICPFGTLHHFFSYIGSKFIIKPKYINYKYSKWQNLKYYILFSLIILAIFKINLIGIFDPLTFLLRSSVSFIIPFIQSAINYFGKLLILLGMSDFGRYLESDIAFAVFGKENIFFGQTFLIGIILITLFIIDLFVYRFYCRFICPLGAFLAIISSKSLLNIKQKEGCIACYKCDRSCFASSNPSSSDNFKKSECMLLGNCLKECPVNVMGFDFLSTRKSSVDVNKRYLLSTACLTIISTSLFRYSFNRERINPKLIRPPGALAELDFLARCLRCSACIKVCPQNFLQPSLIEGRLEALWTPIGSGRLGYCEYNCKLCSEVCPTGAIKQITLEEKKKISIGTAFIDKNRCLPYAFDTECAVCEEMCPVSPKAIYFKEEQIVTRDNTEKIIKRPVVDPDKCTGCAICEFKCPIVDKPAIYITSIGEDRSKYNQFLF